MFLTKEELHELTGYVRPADQCRWLEKRRWKFAVSGLGRPVVLRKHVEEMLSLDVPKKEPARPEPKLNMDAFRKKPR